MKSRSLLLFSTFVLSLVFALSVHGQGLLTVTGSGDAAYAGGFTIQGIPTAPYGKVSVGTFEGITDTEIMESAAGGNLQPLLDNWRPFTPWTGIGEGIMCICLPDFPDPPMTLFSTYSSKVLPAGSPFEGRAVYMMVFWPEREVFPGHRNSPAVVIHKSTYVFPPAGTTGAIDVRIDPARPRLLAGRMTAALAFETPTLTNITVTGYPVLPAWDNWAFAWFGTTPTAPEALPDADPDGDGQNNAEEWKNATSPKDAASRLELHWTIPPTDPSITFNWTSRPGIYYAIIQSDQPDIARPPSRPVDAVRVFDYESTLSVTVPEGASRRFFAIFSWAP